MTKRDTQHARTVIIVPNAYPSKSRSMSTCTHDPWKVNKCFLREKREPAVSECRNMVAEPKQYSNEAHESKNNENPMEATSFVCIEENALKITGIVMLLLKTRATISYEPWSR